MYVPDVMEPGEAAGTISGYVKIGSMVMNEYCSIYGVVVDWLECKESRGSDFVMTLDLVDESVADKLSVKIFSRRRIFAEGFCVGDVVRIQHLKLYGAGKAITDHRNCIEIVYSHVGACDPEDLRVRELVSFFRTNKNRVTKERTVSEIWENQYFDFCGELIDKHVERHNLVVMKLIDYTHNHRIGECETQDAYPNDMVLVVRAWGEFAQVAGGCEIGGFYKIRNLRTDGIEACLSANLSESSRGRIVRIRRNTTFGNYLESRRRTHGWGSMSARGVVEMPARMLGYRLARIRDLDVPGVYRVHVQVKQHTPFRGLWLVRCKTCSTVWKKTSMFRCKCEDAETEDMKLLKLLVSDGSGEIVIVCKNTMAEHILDGESPRYLSGTFFDCVVICTKNMGKTTYHMIDI